MTELAKHGFEPGSLPKPVSQLIKALAGLVLLMAFSPSLIARAETLSPDSVQQTSAASERKLAELLNKLERIRKRADIASVGIALSSRDGLLYCGGLGVERHGSHQGVDEHTWFRLGSITKSFVGLTALRMQQDYPDLFSVAVNTRLPGLLDPQTGGDEVTLAQLLEHTAGLSDLSRKEFDFQGETVTFEEAVKLDPATRTLRWPAARHSSYSNAGYGLAGYFLETVAERSFEQLVDHYVLKPTGMDTAGFYKRDNSPPLAAGYDTDGVTPIPYWHMLYRSFGGLNATPRDMGRFVHSLLQVDAPELLRGTKQRKRFENAQTTLAATTGLEYGYGLGNYHWFSNGVRYHGHGGDADGYLSHYGYSNESGYGYFIVITAFNKKPLKAMRDQIERYLFAMPTLEAPDRALEAPKPIRLPSSVLAAYAGNYVEVTRRFGPLPSGQQPTLTVSVDNGQLVTRHNGRRLGLVALSKEHFRRPWQPAATYAFIRQGEQIYLQGDMGNFRQVPSSSNP